MQTFLPYPDFEFSIKTLDDQRLNKQIIEAFEIFSIHYYKKESKWKNHPATLMWKDYELTLGRYIKLCCQEWWNRDNSGHINENENCFDEPLIKYPDWFGDKLFHASHRSNLLLKSDFYLQYEWVEWEKPYIPYVWPTWYSNFEEKIITPEGYKSLLKALKRRNIRIENCYQYWKLE